MEFTLAFMLLLLFLVLTTRLFVWFNGGLLRRQLSYEATRVKAGTSVNDTINNDDPATPAVESGDPGTLAFVAARKLDILSKDIFNNTP